MFSQKKDSNCNIAENNDMKKRIETNETNETNETKKMNESNETNKLRPFA